MNRDVSSKLLRQRGGEAAVSYVELLFDLIYVFAVTQISHFLLHHLNITGVFQSIVLWVGIWQIWQHTIWVTNWFNPDTLTIRLALFCMMIASLFMTAALPYAFGDKSLVFAFCYVCIQLSRNIFVLLILGKGHSLTKNYTRLLIWTLISSLFWVTGAFTEEYARLILWAIAVFIDYVAPMFRFYLPGLGSSSSGRDWTIDGNLLLERCKLFVIIAFGETILMTGVSLSDLDIWTDEKIIAAMISFVGSLVMWWIYFDSSSEAASNTIKKTNDPGSLGLKYNSIHVILVGAIIVCAVGDELVVTNPQGSVSAISLYVMIYGPIIYILANMAFKWITCRVLMKSHVIGVMLYVILIPFSFYMSLLTVNVLGLLILVLVAVLDRSNPAKSKLNCVDCIN